MSHRIALVVQSSWLKSDTCSLFVICQACDCEYGHRHSTNENNNFLKHNECMLRALSSWSPWTNDWPVYSTWMHHQHSEYFRIVFGFRLVSTCLAAKQLRSMVLHSTLSLLCGLDWTEHTCNPQPHDAKKVLKPDTALSFWQLALVPLHLQVSETSRTMDTCRIWHHRMPPWDSLGHDEPSTPSNPTSCQILQRMAKSCKIMQNTPKISQDRTRMDKIWERYEKDCSMTPEKRAAKEEFVFKKKFKKEF